MVGCEDRCLSGGGADAAVASARRNGTERGCDAVTAARAKARLVACVVARPRDDRVDMPASDRAQRITMLAGAAVIESSAVGVTAGGASLEGLPADPSATGWGRCAAASGRLKEALAAGSPASPSTSRGCVSYRAGFQDLEYGVSCSKGSHIPLRGICEQRACETRRRGPSGGAPMTQRHALPHPPVNTFREASLRTPTLGNHRLTTDLTPRLARATAPDAGSAGSATQQIQALLALHPRLTHDPGHRNLMPIFAFPEDLYGRCRTQPRLRPLGRWAPGQPQGAEKSQ